MRLAVVGLGYMGGVHVKALRQVPGVTLAAVVCRSGNEPDLPGVRVYRDIASALADPEIDAVDLCLPTDLHEPVAIEALRLGKHVLVEKPMALDAAACGRMVDEARRQQRILMVAQVLRFHPAYRALEAGLERLGTIRSAAFRRRCAIPTWGDWLTDMARSGGAVLDLLVHDADIALHWFGPPDAIAAAGPKNASIVSAQLFYPGDLVVEISGGWYPGKVPFTMECTVVADDATLEYRLDTIPPRLCGPDGIENLPQEAVDGFVAEIAYFSQCVRTGSGPERNRPEESALAVRLAVEIQEARKRNGEKVPWK